ncbi:MAG: AGE family epimerase/isomerase [Verrucomicrobiae bacterium]|nr:AGE family epimerase/isomerase [Verrucomicrobiae bacterium]
MAPMTFPELGKVWRRLLLDDVVPFWLRHGIDREYGGVLSCLRDDGTRINTDKYMWSQCRAIWTFSAIARRIAPRADLLQIARVTADFALKHGRDPSGGYAFLLSRKGKILRGATSVYTDFFAAYGLGELFRITGDPRDLAEALAALRGAIARIRDPNFDAFAPYAKPPGIQWVHGIPMIGLEVAQELADVAPERDVLDFVSDCLNRVLAHHTRPARRLVLEHLGPDHIEVDSPAGRAVVPGHGIEMAWFVMHQAQRRKDRTLALRAAEIIRWLLEAGWDREYGGLFLAIDADGGDPWWKHAEMKAWWPHTEALYALLLAHDLTREPWCMEWYWRVHAWSWAHYPEPIHGEWRQRLDRQGRPSDAVIALPVKDPFHLPRAAILSLAVLDRLSQNLPPPEWMRA